MQGGSGQVKSVTFSNIQVSNVRVPIDINQFYYDNGFCTNKTFVVFISDVTYQKITGTYVDTPVNLSCNDDVPCIYLNLINIQLEAQ